MREPLFIAAVVMLFATAPQAFGQSQAPTQKESYECDDKVETGGLPGRERRVQRRMDRNDAKTDCAPKSQTAAKSSTTAAGTVQEDKATVDLCNELADRKNLSGNDRKTFVNQCVSTSGAPAPASTMPSQKDEAQLCNELADRKNLTGTDRRNFLSTCLSAGGSSTSTGTTGTNQDQLRHCTELADRKNLQGSNRTNFLNNCMSMQQGSTSENERGTTTESPSAGRQRGRR